MVAAAAQLAGGDLDVVVLAFGLLGDQAADEAGGDGAVRLAQTNYVGAVSVGLAVARLLRAQGHGTLVVLSSVAGERVRRANFIYGSSKAGLDGFAQGLGDALAGTRRPGAHRPARFRAHQDDRGPAAGPAVDHARGRRRGHRRGPGRGPGGGLGPGALRPVFAVLPAPAPARCGGACPA